MRHDKAASSLMPSTNEIRAMMWDSSAEPFIEHLWRGFSDVVKMNRICSKAKLKRCVRSDRARLQEQAVG